MEDNYLWDRSGEPDPEIQKLEETLGTLRYQPEPLKIPLRLPIGGRSRFLPAMAIAAALALFAVLVGFWFVRTRHQPSILQAKDGKQIDQKVIVPAPEPPAPSGTEPRQIANVKPVIEKHSQPNLIARHERHVPRTGVREPELTAQEMAEKEQVLVALRLVSFKLNLAQRKTQGGPQLNPIRNQHKIG